MSLPVVRRRQGSMPASNRLLPVKKEDPRAMVRLSSQGSLSRLPRRRHTLEPQPAEGPHPAQPSPTAATDALLGRCSRLLGQGGAREPSSEALACKLALKYKLTLSEVNRIMGEFKIAKRSEDGGMERKEFDKVICRIFDLDSVDEQVAKNAYRSVGAQSGLDVETFLVWYRQNMFNTFNALNAAPEKKDSEQLVYDLAQQHDVSVGVVDKAKVKFDYYDLDKSGIINFEEFQNMFCSILKTKNAAELNPDRINRFWQEIDHNGDGGVCFPEFTRWYLKYFNPDVEDPEEFDLTGPLRAFYDSYDPTVQRRNSLRGLSRLRSCQ